MWVYSICVTILFAFFEFSSFISLWSWKVCKDFFLLCLSLFRISTFKLKSETKIQYFYILYYICLNFFVEHCVVPLKKYIQNIFSLVFFSIYRSIYEFIWVCYTLDLCDMFPQCRDFLLMSLYFTWKKWNKNVEK